MLCSRAMRACALWLLASTMLAGACFEGRRSKGGGQISTAATRAASERAPNPYDIDVPPGYRIELVADKLTFPTGVAFDDQGRTYLIEAGYSYGERFTRPRLLEVHGSGEVRELATGDGAPWNGLAFHDGALYVAHGGAVDGGRIVRYALSNGEVTDTRVLVKDLPSLGDHHTNGPAISADGWVYFGQGTATNSAVVGTDNAEFGWLPRQPAFHDIPCADVKLTGLNWTTKNPLTPADDAVTTGVYLPFGQPSTVGQIIKGRVPCSGAIMRVRATGGDVELVAWGLRNPFGLAIDAKGSLLVTENGLDTRGSRPVFGAADTLRRIEPGQWYGWPDYAESRPLTSKFYSESEGAARGFVLAEHPGKPPEPLAYLPSHSSATGLDVSRSEAFGHVGQVFVAEFGDMAPMAGKVMTPVGFRVVRIDARTGEIDPFARNRPDKPGPASERKVRGLERPVAVRFTPDGSALYIVDFGILRMSDTGSEPQPNTGMLWRITREAAHATR